MERFDSVLLYAISSSQAKHSICHDVEKRLEIHIKHTVLGAGSELPVAVGDRPEIEIPEISAKDTPAVNLEPDRDVIVPNGIAATPVPRESIDDTGAKASTPDTAKIEPQVMNE